MQKPEAILFDLDCTLADRPASLAVYARRFVEHFQSRLGAADESSVLACLSQWDQNGYAPRASCWAHVRKQLDWMDCPPAAELDDLWNRQWPACAVALAGTRGMLERLSTAGYVLGVVTNGRTVLQQSKIDALGIRDLLKTVLVSQAVGFAKPHRAIFAAACDAIGSKPRDVWFVGDHPVNDALGARGAGLVDVWLGGFAAWPVGEAAPGLTIDHLSDLLKLLEIPAPG